jgi:ELWxxDGT repeat protein
MGVGDTLYFIANDGTSGFELWKTDGSAAGTVLVKDIIPGPVSATPENLANVDGVLYFSANDGLVGQELWKSDGTEAGTVLVKDFYVGAGGSQPSEITAVGERLYVAVATELHGREIWFGSLSDDSLAGDYNADGVVDGADFLAWQRTLGAAANPAGSGADGDSSGMIDAGDLGVWQSDFGEGASVAAATSAQASRARDSAALDALYAAGDFTSLFTTTTSRRSLGRRAPWQLDMN